MKTIYILISVIALMISPAWAEVYSYLTDQGVPSYTNDLSRVPVNRRRDVEIFPEIPYHPLQDVRARSYGHDYSSYRARQIAARAEHRQNKAMRAKIQRKDALEQEYRQLLSEKTALDNNNSFQKRRIKRKYKHRPYIRALIKKEQQINTRLTEIETMLKKIEFQSQS